jgi:hypothetical protein
VNAARPGTQDDAVELFDAEFDHVVTLFAPTKDPDVGRVGLTAR